MKSHVDSPQYEPFNRSSLRPGTYVSATAWLVIQHQLGVHNSVQSCHKLSSATTTAHKLKGKVPKKTALVSDVNRKWLQIQSSHDSSSSGIY